MQNMSKKSAPNNWWTGSSKDKATTVYTILKFSGDIINLYTIILLYTNIMQRKEHIYYYWLILETASYCALKMQNSAKYARLQQGLCGNRKII